MGRPKLLLPFGDATILTALLASLRRAGVERIAVVVAPHDDELRAAASDAATTVAVNPEPARGMLSSILAGLEALGGADALTAAGDVVLVTPADLPAIQPATIERLIAAMRERGAALAVPVHRAKRGHPLAIAPFVLHEVTGLDPDIGLRQLLDRHPVLELAVQDPGVVSDVDTQADYDRLRAAAEPSLKNRS